MCPFAVSLAQTAAATLLRVYSLSRTAGVQAPKGYASLNKEAARLGKDSEHLILLKTPECQNFTLLVPYRIGRMQDRLTELPGALQVYLVHSPC